MTAELLLPLASLQADASSSQAARRLLGSADPEREIARLYPALLAHSILLPALSHLEREGAALERLTVRPHHSSSRGDRVRSSARL
jgi:hypothetical protein